MKSEDCLRDNIILKSTELFAKNGYSKTSIQKIADSCETSQTNVLYHFKSKKGLFKNCLIDSISKNRSILAKYNPKNDLDALIHLLNTNVNWAIKYPNDCQLFLLMFYFASNDEDFLRLSTEITKEGQNLLKQYLSPFSFKEGFDVESVSLILQNYIHGVMFNIIARDDVSISKNYKQSINKFLESILVVK